MPSRLPITIRPAHNEIAISYLTRLATLHDLPLDELWEQVTTPGTATNRTRRLDGGRLAAVANQPRTRLARAVIEVRDPEPDWLTLRHEPQHGCRRCNARHPGGTVLQLLGHHRYVCTRHRIWIGPPDQPHHPQPTLTQLPEIVAAQHAHLRLLHRLGPAATYDAVLTAFLICAHRWNFTDTAPIDGAGRQWTRRAALLIPPGTEPATFSPSRLFAAIYPEAVSIAELIASLHWRRLAAGGPHDQRRFAAEIGRRLGQPDYRPTQYRDPIAHWIEQDCWQPPSLPVNDYRHLPTYGGKNYRKPHASSEQTRATSASWFAIHRRGGDALLHHRTLTPVLVRDWSPRMELFDGTLNASASTTPQPTRHTTAPASIEYIRPHPAASPYLDTTTEPAPWPHRTQPREPRGGRPWLPGEKPMPHRARYR